MKIVRKRYILTRNNGTEVAVMVPNTDRFIFRKFSDTGTAQILSFGERPKKPRFYGYEVTEVNEVYVTVEGNDGK